MCSRNPHAAHIAQTALLSLERLEALLASISDQAQPSTYLETLANLGQELASGYVSEMSRYAEEAGGVDE